VSFPRRLAWAAYRVAFLAACAALSLWVFWCFVRDPGINVYERARFADVVYGRAHRPFVERVLVPGTVRVATALVPEGARAQLRTAMAQDVLVQGFLRRKQWDAEHLPEYAVALALMYAALAGFAFALRWLAKGLFPQSPLRQDAAVVLGLAGLVPCFYYASYLSDFPGLLLWTLGLGLMLRGRWRTFLVVFVLGCLNKETFALMPLLFAVRFWRFKKMGRRQYWTLLGAQVVLFAAIQGAIAYAFRDNPGSAFELHWGDHTLALMDHLARRNGSLLVAAWLLGAALAFLRWKDKPRLLRQAILVVLPTLVALTAAFGFLDELRDYYEAFPVLVLMLVHTLFPTRKKVQEARAARGAFTLGVKAS
jgi:uncharacterized membrane protein